MKISQKSYQWSALSAFENDVKTYSIQTDFMKGADKIGN
nr:MAG TPA: hypothetical protein [Caudoviricetes sp.]